MFRPSGTVFETELLRYFSDNYFLATPKAECLKFLMSQRKNIFKNLPLSRNSCDRLAYLFIFRNSQPDWS